MRQTPRSSFSLIYLVIFACAGLSIGATGVPADTDETPLATFRLSDEVFEFHHAVAFRTTELEYRLGKETMVVVLTRDAIDEADVAASVAEEGNWFGSGHVRLTLRYDADGTFIWGMFQAGGNNLQLDHDKIDATTQVETSRISGTLSQQEPSEFFEDKYILESASFDVAVLAK